MALGRVRPLALIALLVFVGALTAACSDSPTSPTGVTALSFTDLRVGSGLEAASGHIVSVHYTLWLYDADRPEQKGLLIESSAGGSPFGFLLGAGQVIEGWDRGLVGVKPGGIRRLVVPSSLGYGGIRQNQIPPFTPLVFEVEIVSVEVLTS